MSARSDPATPLATPRDDDAPASSAAPTPIPQPPAQLRSAASAPPRQRRPPELKIDPPRADLRALNPTASSMTPRPPPVSTPNGKGSLVEIGDGWARCTPGDGGRAYFWHRKNDRKQFDAPVLKTEVLNKQLLRAAAGGDAEQMGELLKGGANVNAADPTGTTPAMKAAASGDMECLKALLAYKPSLQLVNSQGRTALHIAAFWGRVGFGTDPGCIGALMRAGADPKAAVVGSEDGTTPTQLACIGLLGDGSSPTGGGMTPRTPRAALVPRGMPGSPVIAPAINKSDVELLLSVGPDEYSAIKQEELDEAKRKRDEAKRRAMKAALAKNALRRFQSTPSGPAKPPRSSTKLARINSVDDEAVRRREKAEEEAAKEEQAAKEAKEEDARRKEDVAKTIQRHARGAIARMKTKERLTQNRLGLLLARLAKFAKRMEDGDPLTETELQQLAADTVELLALLKERPELADLIRERHCYEALDVLRRAQMLVKLAVDRNKAAMLLLKKQREKQSGEKNGALWVITDALRQELRDKTISELKQRAAKLRIDPNRQFEALASAGVGQRVTNMAELLLKTMEGAGHGDDLLRVLSTALKSELALLPTEELTRRAIGLGIEPSIATQALSSTNPNQMLAELIVDKLLWDATDSKAKYMVGRFSSNLSKNLRDLLAGNIASNAMDTMLLVEPDRVMARIDKENTSAQTIQRHARGRISRTNLEARRAKLDREREAKARHVQQTNAAVRIQQSARGGAVRKQAEAMRQLRMRVAQVIVKRAMKWKLNAMRKRAEKQKSDNAARIVQACWRGHETRKLLEKLGEERIEVWAFSGHTRAARQWFERYSGLPISEQGWLTKPQLHQLVIELRSRHGLPMFDAVVEREVQQMMDGTWDQPVGNNDTKHGVSRRHASTNMRAERPKGKTYHDKLSFPRWLKIIRASEKRTVPTCAPPAASQFSGPAHGWSHNTRWALEYPHIRGGDPIFPRMKGKSSCGHSQNRFYPVGSGLSGRDIPGVGATQSPGVTRKPLAQAIWTWCGESSQFVLNNRV